MFHKKWLVQPMTNSPLWLEQSCILHSSHLIIGNINKL